MVQQDRLLTTTEVAQMLGITPAGVWAKVQRGTLQAHLTALGNYGYRSADVRAYRSRRRPWQVRWAKERHL